MIELNTYFWVSDKHINGESEFDNINKDLGIRIGDFANLASGESINSDSQILGDFVKF